MTPEQLTAWDEDNWQTSRAIIEETQEDHPPLLLIRGKQDALMHVGALMQNERGKDVLGKIMQEAAQKYEGICLVSEGWAVIASNRSDLDLYRAGVPPSQHPSRVEVLTMMYTAKGLGNSFVHHRIVTKEGKRTVERGELLISAQAEGRFAPETT